MQIFPCLSVVGTRTASCEAGVYRVEAAGTGVQAWQQELPEG